MRFFSAKYTVKRRQSQSAQTVDKKLFSPSKGGNSPFRK